MPTPESTNRQVHMQDRKLARQLQEVDEFIDLQGERHAGNLLGGWGKEGGALLLRCLQQRSGRPEGFETKGSEMVLI